MFNVGFAVLAKRDKISIIVLVMADKSTEENYSFAAAFAFPGPQTYTKPIKENRQLDETFKTQAFLRSATDFSFLV